MLKRILQNIFISIHISSLFVSSYTINPKVWRWKTYNIAYEKASNHDDSKTSSCDPILLLNGFGVGTFHQHRLIPQLLSSEEDINNQIVYGIDYLGQGSSWPIECDDGNSLDEKGLVYSIDTWGDQLISFMEDVIIPAHTGRKIHLVGNSVGGLLSVLVANKRPDLISSICLLNATPVWGLNLPGWDGKLPPPQIPRYIGRYLFNKIREFDTIEKYLETAYANRSAFDKDLMQKIRECTEGSGGHAAFASILYSPPATFVGSEPKSFYKNLTKLKCDVLLIFGREDPWCSPAFGRKMMQCLLEREKNVDTPTPIQRYIELENVGHCPNHEAPTTVGKIVMRWIRSNQRSDEVLIDEEIKVVHEPWGKISAREVDRNDLALSFMDSLITNMI